MPKTNSPTHQPIEGYVWHPLRRYPRNIDCFCGSKKKAKKCCLPKLPAACPSEKAKQFNQYLRDIGAA